MKSNLQSIWIGSPLINRYFSENAVRFCFLVFHLVANHVALNTKATDLGSNHAYCLLTKMRKHVKVGIKYIVPRRNRSVYYLPSTRPVLPKFN